MIEARNIAKYYGCETILEKVDLRIGPGEKIGIIGRNGAGKTTLVRILTGEDPDHTGRVIRTANEHIGYVAQHFEGREGNALEYMIEDILALRIELAALEEAMGQSEGRILEQVLEQYGEVRQRYDVLAGDVAEERALAWLEGIGLVGREDRPVSRMSGGEKNILALGRALVARPEVLILDEPGNHLDMAGMAWLEGFIREYPGTVLVISHNRYLLDRVCSRILEVDQRSVNSFTGNYSAYRITRLRNAVSGEMAWKADQKKIARLEALVKKFEEITRRTADAAWGRRLRSRRKHLERVKERSAEKPVDPVASYSVSFDAEASKAQIALKVEGLRLAFGERILLDDVSLLIRTGERVALVGPNGSGKTSFINEVLKRAAEQDPSVYIGPSLTVAVCTQHGEGLDFGATIFDACLKAGAKNEDEAGRLIARFLFPRAALAQHVGTLSGGEINRLQLALAVQRKANFLILDEPTNHMDIASCEAIEDALEDFAGTILVISHDRYFLDRIATRVLEIDEGRMVSWEGNFSEFWAERHGSMVSRPIRSVKGQKEVIPLEERIMALEQEQRAIETNMGAAYTAGDLGKARTLGGRLARIVREIERLYSEWGA